MTPGERREQGLQLQLLLLKSFGVGGGGRGGGSIYTWAGMQEGEVGAECKTIIWVTRPGEKQDGAFLAFEFRGRRNAFWNFNDHLLQLLLLPSPPRPKSNISPFSQLLLCGRILSCQCQWSHDDDQGGDKHDLDDDDDVDHCDDLGDDQLKYSPRSVSFCVARACTSLCPPVNVSTPKLLPAPNHPLQQLQSFRLF